MPHLSFEEVLDFFSPVAHWLSAPGVSEVMINADLRVFIEQDGRKSEVDGAGLHPPCVYAAARRIARAEGVEVDEEHPVCNARFGDGQSRVCIVLPPASPHGPVVSIRLFRRIGFTAEELVTSGSLTPAHRSYLEGQVQDRRNILIAGAMSTGKTSLLSALAQDIPDTDRILLLEQPPEIQLHQPNVVALQASDTLSFASLIRNAVLRLNADRIILGEVRGEEAFDLLRVLNTGHGGSFATVHADSPEEALYTIASLAVSAKPNVTPLHIREQVAKAIHTVVFVTKRPSGQRVVTEIVRVIPTLTSDGKFMIAEVTTEE